MRYEDVSQTGTAGNVDARDDADHLASNDFGPATGNLITGAGTITGATGTDSSGHIVAIQGAGGSDNTFADGKLEIAGQYGTLTIDADGNYSYVRNAGSPEGVSDTFTYTLADAAGATDTANLVINIGDLPMLQAQGGQTIQTANGVVVLPAGVELSDVRVVGRDLVVTLPDGSTMVIPDGAIFVPQLVVDGVEVPASNLAALLIDSEPKPGAGDITPNQLSSGGNFGLPPGPLDPGVPLGDLIPPTELFYTPPEVHEIFVAIDKEPEAGIVSVQLDDDVVPLAGGNNGGVGDDPPNAPEDNVVSGSLPGSGGDGQLTWALLDAGAPAGFSYELQLDGSIEVVQVQDGNPVVVLTITVNEDTGAFVVTQDHAIRHATGDNENNADFVINYTVTDEDGDTATGSLNINVDDDTPTASVTAGDDSNVLLITDDADTIGNNSDTDVTLADFSGVFGATTSSAGADGAGAGTTGGYTLGVTSVNSGLNSHGAAINLYLVGTTVVGATGSQPADLTDPEIIFTVSVDAGGIVTLTQLQQIDHAVEASPVPGTDAPFNDQFASLTDNLITLTRSLTIVDKDGDSVTQSATVNIGANLHFTDDGPTIDPSLNEVGSAIVDESAPVDAQAIVLADGYTAGDDPHLAGGLAIGSGSTSGPVIDANASFGADGPKATGSEAYALEVTNTVSGLTTTEGTAINLVKLSNGVVIGVVDGTTTAAFAIQIDATSGVVTVEQYLSLNHPDFPSNYDEAITLDEGSLGVTVTATDFDGDTATSDPVDITPLIQFHDDGPNAVNDGSLGSFDDNVSGVNIGTVAGLLANDDYGADGPAASGSITIATGSLGGTISIVAGNLIYTSNHNVAPGGSEVETFTYTIKDGDLDTDTATFSVTLTDGGPSINEAAASIAVDEEGLTNGLAGTVYGDGSDLAGTATTQSGTLAGLSFGVDGPGDIVLGAVADTGLRTLANEVVKSVWNGATHTLTGFVDTNGNNVVDGGETQVFTLQITNVNTGAYAFTLLQPVKHATANTEDNATFNVGVTVTDNEGDPANGSISVLIDDDSPDAVNDGSRGTFDDGVVSQNIGNVSVLLANDAYGADGPAASNAITIAVGSLGGTISIDGSGNMLYTSNHDVTPGNTDVETFTYTITDGDGDQDTATFTVSLTDGGPVIGTTNIAVDEEGLAGGLAGTVYGDGSDLAGTATTQSGTLTGISFGPDGAGNVVLAAVADTGLRTLSNHVIATVWDGGTHTLTGFDDANGNGVKDGGEASVFTLQITNVGTGAYTYTQLLPVKHAIANTEDNATFSVGVTVTDSEGDPANGTINVLIDDDSPDAVNDGSKGSFDDNSSSVNIGTVASLLANDTYGADGPAASNSITIATGSLGGTISIVAGNLIYTSNHNVAPGGNAVETFTYTITDGDGDQDTATFSVTLTDTGPTIDAAPASIAVDEEGLAGGLAGTVYGDGSDLAGTATTQSGTLSGLSFGFDGPGNIVLAGAADTGLRTLANAVVKSVWDNATHTLTGFVDTNGNNVVDGGELQVFTLQITNVNTGAYTYTQLQPVKHATANTEDNATFNVGVTVTDAEGDAANGTISVLIDDDSPDAVNDGNKATIDDNSSSVNIGTVASLLANDSYGIDGPAASNSITIATGNLGGTISIVAGNLIYTSNHNTLPGGSDVETFTYTITDGDGDQDTATFTVTLTDTGPTIDAGPASISVDEEGLTGGIAGTTYGDGSDLAGTATTQSGTLSGLSFGFDGPGNIVLAGAADTGLRTLANAVVKSVWNNATHTLTGFVDTNGNNVVDGGELQVFTLQITNVNTGAYTYTQLQPVKHATANTEDNATFNVGVTVTDAEGDSASGTISVLIDDDSPTAVSAAAISSGLTNDGNDSATASLDTGDNNVFNNFGADGGKVIFTDATKTHLEGLNFEHSGAALSYNISTDGQLLTAFVDTGTAGLDGGDLQVFTIQLQPGGSSNYTVTLLETIDTTTTIDFNDGGYDFAGGNDPWAAFRTAANDDSKDLLMTPIVSGVSDGNIQTSSILGGVNNSNDVAATETFRIDFVTDVLGDPAKTGGATDYSDVANQDHTFDGHYLTNDAAATFSSTSPGTSDVTIKALLDPDGNNVVGDGAPVTITSITISYAGGTPVLVSADGSVTVNSGLATERTYVVDFKVDGTVQIDDVFGTGGAGFDGTRISVHTATGYNSLEYGNVGGDPYKIGDFGIVVTTAAPVDFTVPITVIDGDGDTVSSGNLSIHADAPTPPVVLDLNGDGVHFLGQDAGVTYDYGAGLAATAWAAADDGILVRDANHNGNVDNASEFVFGGNGVTDMEALHAQYGDTLDANDADFAMFAVWNDANSNGVVDANELQSLAQAGITSIGLVSDGISYSAGNGDVTVVGTASYTRADGSTGDAADAIFSTGTGAKATQEVERIAANSNNVALAAAVAAAGVVASSPAAAAPAVDDGGHQAFVSTALVAMEPVADLGNDRSAGLSFLSAFQENGFDLESQPMASTSHMAISTSQVGELVSQLSMASAPTALLDATDFGGMLQMPSVSTAMSVAMASAQSLMPVQAGVNAQHTGAVEQIIADALHGGGASTDINALLNALPGSGIGADAGLHGLATAGGGDVPIGDMGHGGVFTFDVATIITSEAMVLHHDAVQPAANG